MAKQYFYHGLIRNYTIAFGSLFNDIEVIKYNNDRSEAYRHKVPLTYAKKEKFIAKHISKSSGRKEVATILPRISFEIIGLVYAPERKISAKRRLSVRNNSNADSRFAVRTPIPYDINFNLSVYTKTQEEAMQIVEQIIPYFDPDYTLSLKMIKAPDSEGTPDTFDYDVPISILSSDPDDSAEGSFDDRRAIIWSFSFVLKGYFFGPIANQKVIKEVEMEIYSSKTNELLVSQTTQPYIEGVDISDIHKDDNWTPQTTTVVHGAPFSFIAIDQQLRDALPEGYAYVVENGDFVIENGDFVIAPISDISEEDLIAALPENAAFIIDTYGNFIQDLDGNFTITYTV